MKITKWLYLVAVLVVVVASAGILLAGCQARTAAQDKILYHCPMHPDYVSDKPGDCPICGMRLVPMEKAKGEAPKVATSEAAKPKRLPAVVQASQPESGSVEQQPVQAIQQPAQTTQQPAPTTQQPPMPDMPGMPGMPTGAGGAGRAGKSGGVDVAASPTSPNLAGVRTVAAVTGTLTGTIRAVGAVVTPETGVRQVTTKVPGWVQKLYVNSVGRAVRAGEPLFELYSPELLASQEEYLHAREVATQFGKSSLPEVQRGGQDLLTSARRRLELFDVPPDFMARLDETGKVQRTVMFRAPFGGYVLEKTVVEGQRVEPGMNLMTIADLSRAWVTAQVYESEAAAAQVGHAARVTLPYDSSVKLTGRIDLVYPTLEAESRTLKVRLQFPNPRLALKPGMFVNVELDAQRAQGVVVPDSALIDTGTRQVVFVQTQPGHFEPRDVQAGLRSEGKVILRSGVRAGEQVAVAANFLLDSESRLRAGR